MPVTILLGSIAIGLRKPFGRLLSYACSVNHLVIQRERISGKEQNAQSEFDLRLIRLSWQDSRYLALAG